MCVRRPQNSPKLPGMLILTWRSSSPKVTSQAHGPQYSRPSSRSLTPSKAAPSIIAGKHPINRSFHTRIPTNRYTPFLAPSPFRFSSYYCLIVFLTQSRQYRPWPPNGTPRLRTTADFRRWAIEYSAIPGIFRLCCTVNTLYNILFNNKIRSPRNPFLSWLFYCSSLLFYYIIRLRRRLCRGEVGGGGGAFLSQAAGTGVPPAQQYVPGMGFKNILV